MNNIEKNIGNVTLRSMEEMILFSKDTEEDIIDCEFVNENKFRIVENLEFKRCVFRNCKLEGRFDKSYFTYVIFENCDLSNCYFNESNFNLVTFRNCKLVGTNIIECRLNNVDFESNVLNYASFNMCRLRDIVFIHSEMVNSSFQEVEFNKVSFVECSLQKTQFLRTKLNGIDFRTCDISGISTRIEDLRGAIVTVFQAAELAKLLEIVIK